ncbi:DNA adenine methylase [Ammoniphilus sp. CFH 90114]|uniref:DNA adenine methylase n=1 Tax=Ammoniphilus sp. CFH 90114 TaxID=2493665 RepID=UPI00100E6494|nr:DNA adenine methylase [Ammoniphilus sp. CFH 90114]RXT08835.1 DNA adenine methylase [Ammoniphilus sp. CFH 90114]
MTSVRRVSSLDLNNSHPHSVISYIGGKSQLIPNIVPIITYAANTYGLSKYYELCGGGARMLLNMPVTLFEHRVYNDLDLGLCKLFACLGDKRYLYDLMALLEDLGCSEEVFLQAKHAREFETRMLARGRVECELDRVLAAAYTFILAMQSRAADMNTFDNNRVRDRKRLRSYFKRVHQLDRFFPTLKDVEITHGDCLELLDWVGSRGDSFAYIDPPYIPDSMVNENHYGERSWVLEDHVNLVNKLLFTNMKVALSGYDNDCYDRLIKAGWQRLYLKNVHVSSSASGRRKQEYIWINFPIPYSLIEEVSLIDYIEY